MAQHDMDTLSINNFNEVNIQTNPSACSAQNSDIASSPSFKKVRQNDKASAQGEQQNHHLHRHPPSSPEFNSKLITNSNTINNSGLDVIKLPSNPLQPNGNVKNADRDDEDDVEEAHQEKTSLLNNAQKCGQPKPNRASLHLRLDDNRITTAKPKLVVKTVRENPLDSSNVADDDDDRQPHHVQFNGVLQQNSTHLSPPVKTDQKLPSPTVSISSNASDSSSSSSSSSSSDESIDLSDVPRPPDGGWGWVIVGVSFIVNLIADGITFSFGVIYHEFLEYFGEDKSTTSWIGSLFMAMPLISGPIASFLTDRYGCRRVTIVGSVLASTGFVASSFANSTVVLYATFGVLAGLGLSLCYVASVVIVAYYFDKKRSFATGLAVCGSGIGTFIFAPLIQSLLKYYGWRGTTLILAGLFLNLAVCGSLMRDLPWTSYKHKSAAKERKRKRELRRKKLNGSSADTFSVSNSTNTASALQPIVEAHNESGDSNDKDRDDTELLEVDRFSSLVNLPTYIRNGEKVPVEVLELLSSTHKNVYNVLMQNYPNLLPLSRSFSDSGRLHKSHMATGVKNGTLSPLIAPPPKSVPSPQKAIDNAYLNWMKHDILSPKTTQKKNPNTAYLRDLRVHRLSLTYRGAMLNINRYRLRASSCPDIYRNSMTTIAEEKTQWYSGILDFWDLIVDIIDVSHFANSKFLLFSISNFLLYTWYDVEYMYLTDYSIGMGFSDTDGSILISVIGIVNMFGEIILGWIGDQQWANPSLVYAVCMVFCGLVTALVPLLKSYGALCFAAGGFGFFIAANYSLTCIILVELLTLERFTNAYGLLLLVQGIANLVGPPIAGKISDVTNSYVLAFYLAGFFIAISGLLLTILPTMKKYKKFRRQVSGSGSTNENELQPKCCKKLTSCIFGKKSLKERTSENHV